MLQAPNDESNQPVAPAESRNDGFSLPSPSRLEKWIFRLFVGFLILLPLFFLPTGGQILPQGKTIFLAAGVLLFLILFFWLSVQGRRLTLPRSPIVLLPLVIVLSALLSAIFGFHFWLSFLGYGFETETVGSLFILFCLFLLAVLTFNGRKKITVFLLAVLGSFLPLFLFYFSRLWLGPEFLSFGVFGRPTDLPLGSWNELGLLAGLIALISANQLLSDRPENRRLSPLWLWPTFIAAVLTLAIVNFPPAWILTFLFSIFILGFWLVKESPAEIGPADWPAAGRRSRLFLPVGLFLLSLLFILPAGQFFSERIYSGLGISFREVRPLLSVSLQVAAETLKEGRQRLIFGAGPNNFFHRFALYKPEAINRSEFWNLNFNAGFGFLPTVLTTGGLLGSLSWLAFLVGLFFLTFKYLFRRPAAALQPAVFAAALGAFYLWAAAFVYPLSPALLALAFIFSGALVSGLLFQGTVGGFQPDFLLSPRKILPATAIFLVVLAAALSLNVLLAQRTLAELTFRAASAGSETESRQHILRALQISRNDRYLGALSRSYLSEFLRKANDPEYSGQTQELQAIFNETLAAADQAAAFNSLRAENWIYLGSVYQLLVPFAADSSNLARAAEGAYRRASELDPLNPLPDLSLASLAFNLGAPAEARQLTLAALGKKPDFEEAVILFSQIEKQLGNLDETIAQAEAAADRQNYFHNFQLGLLYYQQEDFTRAIESLARALSGRPSFTNARYFLALALAQAGRREEALGQLKILLADFPGQSEFRRLAENLKAGGDLFEGTAGRLSPPIGRPPEAAPAGLETEAAEE